VPSKNVPITSNRRRIYHFLRRSQRFHAPCSVSTEIDVTPLFAAIDAAKARGEQAGFTAAIVKATGLIVRAHPQFNQHLFHGLLGGRRVAQFEGVHCAAMVQRRDPEGEDVLFPAILRDADARSIADLHTTIDRYKRAPLGELPEYQMLRRLKKLPQAVRLLMAYRQRSNPAFYEKTFAGTYGISAFAGHGKVPITTHHALAPTACSFFIGTAMDKPWVVDGAVVVRKVLSITIVVDHFLLDGVEVVDVLSELGALLASPAALGLAPAAAAATSSSRSAA
jgi:2-oxoisovalerate dehydrogenase E2 component (dihydrolipoyl transacylase)